ncbi:NAD(P)/FAD-dependent oxidoreductase [Acetobacterium malicum]|uniref:NAD(P)/FAD-dependent oxidoreductase n=1 Tax=Acetobacterium malicum TaxID=52692 RepID=UPI00040B9C13|nr:FAD-dependent oxidoreductase [Acetobacterium dehalogenans]
MKQTDVIVIGGGPAGLAAALAAQRGGARTLLIEREPRLGGILKQCIHDGFGLVRFSEQLTGPEYAERDINAFKQAGIEALTTTFVTRIKKTATGFILTAVNQTGVLTITAKALVLATGCRERTARQVFIHGTRPAGIFTAGTAQHYINLLGQMPTKKCVILGSGDIGLIMARRLTLEGATVLGVYEAKATPSGLTRNLYQCLHDFDIPLHLSQTVTRVYGEERLTAVEVCAVDEAMQPISGTSQKIDCDALILSVGLIPENELAISLGVELDPKTKGPICNATLMTSVDGVFSCGNALHVNDLVDYVSESGQLAGTAAADFSHKQRVEIALTTDPNFAYLVPQRLDLNDTGTKTIVYFRSQQVLKNCDLIVMVNEREVLRKHYSHLRPPEMERLEVDFAHLNLTADSILSFKMEVH